MQNRSEKLGVFYHDKFLSYRAPSGMFDANPSPYLEKQIEQPEGPERILNTKGVLERTKIKERIEWFEPEQATDDELLMFHTQKHLEDLISASEEGRYMSASTYMNKGQMEIVRLSAGSALGAARHVISGKGKIAYSISRPPSHHAAPEDVDGYCYVNGVGLAALEAMKNNYKRIAIIDWDVHHGNGTQEGFYHRDDVLTISMHMNHGSWGPSHLQTGGVEEIGTAAGKGFNINLPLHFGSGDICYNEVFRQCVVPAVTNFNPDLIVLANGQDANQFDPNGRQCVTMQGYYSLAEQIRKLSIDLCDGKLIMTQEGGYNPTYAPYCAYAVAAGLLNEALEIVDPIAMYPEDKKRAERDVAELIESHPLLNS